MYEATIIAETDDRKILVVNKDLTASLPRLKKDSPKELIKDLKIFAEHFNLKELSLWKKYKKENTLITVYTASIKKEVSPPFELVSVSESEKIDLKDNKIINYFMNKHHYIGNLNFYRYLTVYAQGPYGLLTHGGREFSLNKIKDKWSRVIPKIKQNNQQIGMYIHIPFCPTKCKFCFCDCYATNNYDEIEEYTKLLICELLEFKDLFKGFQIDNLWFGGGTPTYLKPKDIDKIFKVIYDNYDVNKNKIYFEASPNSIDEEKLKILKKCGVRRLTIGVQSLDPKVLKESNRPQTKEQVKKAVELAKKYIPYVNIEIIAGLKHSTIKSVKEDVDFCLDLGIDMLHLYEFELHPRTIFVKSGDKLSERDVKVKRDALKLLNPVINSQLEPHFNEGSGKREASNFQEIGRERQNMSLLGIGYGAQSHIFGEALYAHPETPAFRTSKDKIPKFFGIDSNIDEEMRRYVINNIYTGIDKEDFKKLFKVDAMDVFEKEMAALDASGEILITKKTIQFNRNTKRDIPHGKRLEPIYRFFYSKKRTDEIIDELKKTNPYDEKEDYSELFDKFFDSRLRGVNF